MNTNAAQPNSAQPNSLFVPHSIEAEMSVLGAMLFAPGAVEQAVEVLTVEDFYRDNHALLFDVMFEMHEEGVAIDAVTLKERLIARDALEQIGGVGYVMQLGDLQFTSAHVRHYAGIVRDHAIRRRVLAAATAFYRHAQDTDLAPADLLAWAQTALENCDRARGSGGWTPIAEMADVFESLMQQRMENRQQLTGIASGLTALDRATLGLRKGELIILAGRPGMGKSSCAASIALNVARRGGRVGFLSAEMSKPSLMDRLVASESGVPLRALQTGTMHDGQKAAMQKALARIRGMALHIDDAPGVSVTLAESRARRLRRDVGGLDLLVVDYLQYLAPSEGERFASTREKVTDVTRRLKNVARYLNVPVIALAQLSREVEKREDKRPMKSDLAESGAIEAEADMIWFLYRASQYGKRIDRSGNEATLERGESATLDRAVGGIPCDVAQILISKNRNGPEGYVQVGFIEETTRFDNLEEGVF